MRLGFPGCRNDVFAAYTIKSLSGLVIYRPENWREKEREIVRAITVDQREALFWEKEISFQNLCREKARLLEPHQASKKFVNPPAVIQRTPTDHLISALGEVGPEYATPERYLNKENLSNVSALSLAQTRNSSYLLKDGMSQRALPSLRRAIDHEMGRLQFLFWRYIEYRNSIAWSREDIFATGTNNASLLGSLQEILSEENANLLRTRGYDVTDLETWSWILTASSPERSAQRLNILVNMTTKPLGSYRPVPNFIFLLLLRRDNMNARGFRLLINHAWHRLLNQRPREKSQVKQDYIGSGQVPYPLWDENSIVIMVIRLMRQARKLSPASLESISAMVTNYIPISSGKMFTTQNVLTEEVSARLAFIYNTMLSLLALPSSLLPFRSICYHERAQFSILRRMEKFNPPLIVNREGYRALIQVQLAQSKTQRERKWAQMKALSWPPWKEEKLGIDSDITVEDGQSRAAEIVSLSKQAGYAALKWEETAMVIAGWDTDGSPTIQTRATLPSSTSFGKSYYLSVASKQDNFALWTARIRATRTIDEAWSCYLACRRQTEAMPSQSIYFVMFEKLVFEAKRKRLKGELHDVEDSESIALPGDHPETWPKPGPQQAIYVPTPPPSVDEFFEIMLNDRMQPSGPLLTFLLKSAGSFREGIKYLKSSTLPAWTIAALVNDSNLTYSLAGTNLGTIDLRVFSAYIHFLSRFSPGRKWRQALIESRNEGGTPLSPIPRKDQVASMNPLAHAFELMSRRKPAYRPPWNSLLLALSHPDIIVDAIPHFQDLRIQGIKAWDVMRDILAQMDDINLEIDFQGFQNLCRGFENAVLCSREFLRTEHTFIKVDESCQTELWNRSTLVLKARSILSDGLSVLKRRFDRLVAPDLVLKSWDSAVNAPSNTTDPMTKLPGLLEVPCPPQLHAFMRAIGVIGDYDGMLDLLRWTNSHFSELKVTASLSIHWEKQMKKFLIAVRVFLEPGWFSSGGHGVDSAEGASDALLTEAYNLINAHEDWGGWPSDEEVMDYCSKSRWGPRAGHL